MRGLLDVLRLRGTARSVKRAIHLTIDGARALIRRAIANDMASPKVGQALFEVSLPSLPENLTSDLRRDNPELVELQNRYQALQHFKEIVAPRWAFPPNDFDLRQFRAHGDYLWTKELGFRYWLTARYVRKIDRLNLLGLFGEDQAFGEPAISYGGIRISRDKLDSILETYYLMDRLGFGVNDRFTALDIGSGYGRLAHRLGSLCKHASIYCVDAVPLSTFLSRFYLQHRQVSNARVVAFDELDVLPYGEIDFAVSVHSFPEQTQRSVEFWMTLLDRLAVKRLALVDHNGQWLTMEPPDNRRGRYFHILEEHGWVMVDCRPKYTTFMGNLFGIYPEAVYALFARR